ncbi:cell division regulator GpsB [Fructilactobacillus myrtifloralis]|uniref:Cell division regulator GpsB n=1 Tax=Fructilactobacillus myrtifloralis TaxID=2940301 RepID=A0ABY5BQX9_9LACO|nr:cell division regulator GpsB [Fructilactobacillus myrtifloralis]USS85326.1 cell division regulator GpsB [Fructilactobacillus myrtifloralis]
MDSINFTPKDILQKEFRQKMRGYDPTDVDSFLDEIIKDYETFQKELDDKDQRIAQLVAENNQLKAQQVAPTPQATPAQPQPRSNTQAQPTASESQATDSTTLDILRRLSNLEQRVFGDGYHG